MKDKELDIDFSCRVLYSKPCKKAILGQIALPCPEYQKKGIWNKIQEQYVAFLRGFLSAKKRCDKRGDYEMEVDPYEKGKPIHYVFHSCPVAEFVKEHSEYVDEAGYRRNR